MSALTVEANPQAIPILPRLLNSASSALVHLFMDKALPYPICGAVVGSFYDKPVTFGLCSSIQMLIWHYVTPYTIELVFINKYSNSSSWLIGKTLTYGTGILGSYYLTKKLTGLIAHYFPSQKMITEENKEPFLKKYAVYSSFVAHAPTALYLAAYATLFVTHVTLRFAAGQLKGKVS
jgi:hypothetical protein